MSVLWHDGGTQAGIPVTPYVFEAGVAILSSADLDLLRLAHSGMKAILERKTQH